MKFGSLFSGIGGGDLGAQIAGMECAWQVEIDTSCRVKLAEQWPDAERFIDVRDCGSTNLQAVDVVIGGFPCQDVSVAGNRAGLAGERSGLWFEFHRILSELGPSWVVIENVPGLLSSNQGRDFAVILRGLVELGYGVTWRVLDAQYFGLAQRRKRVFIVGHLGDGRSAEVLFEQESLQGNSPPIRKEEKDIAAPLTSGSARSSGVNAPGRRREDDINLISYGIRRCQTGANGSGISENCVHALDGSGGDAVCYGISENQRGEVVLTEYSHQLTTGGGKPGQGYPAIMVSGTLVAGAGKNRNSGKANEADFLVASTINAGYYKKRYNNQQFFSQNGDAFPVTEYGVRRLTPTECERLQGFPDGWTAGQSDSARYRQLGNAWAVPVATWIMKRIIERDSQ